MYDVDQRTVLSVINLLGDEFYTKDVSSHSLMINAHRTLAQQRNYHAFVGKVLKRLTDSNGQHILTELQSKTSRGSRWRVNKTPSQMNKTQLPHFSMRIPQRETSIIIPDKNGQN